jgi:hypothetical protein
VSGSGIPQRASALRDRLLSDEELSDGEALNPGTLVQMKSWNVPRGASHLRRYARRKGQRPVTPNSRG